MPASSKMNLPLAKAVPTSTSGITEKQQPRQEEIKRGVMICESNNSADTKVSAEVEGGGAPCAGAEIPLQPMRKTTLRQAVPLQPTEDPMPKQVGVSEGDCDPIGHLQWSRLRAGPVERGIHAGAGLLVGLETQGQTNAEAVRS
ncbi:suppression of tumorigenicity 5 protein isoform x4 [Pitangus sulphuratus]|nr:suppression of tumorigenicity 5 protein isoform x4 [Pitangus sulphuratus]